MSRTVRLLLASVAFAATAIISMAATEELQYEGRVVVGPDGNGWVAAKFPTIVEGDNVTYYLEVWTGCGERSAFDDDQPCPKPVKAVGVTLNGEVVLRKSSPASSERVEVALNLAGTTDNEIMVSADGELGTAASFAIVAVWR